MEVVRTSGTGGSLGVEVICGCAFAHENTPDGKTGCGRSWSLAIEWDGQ